MLLIPSAIAPTPRARVNRVLAAEDTELVIKPHATEAAVINLLYRFGLCGSLRDSRSCSIVSGELPSCTLQVCDHNTVATISVID